MQNFASSILFGRSNWLKIYFLANGLAANRLNGTGFDRRPGRHRGPKLVTPGSTSEQVFHHLWSTANGHISFLLISKNAGHHFEYSIFLKNPKFLKKIFFFKNKKMLLVKSKTLKKWDTFINLPRRFFHPKNLHLHKKDWRSDNLQILRKRSDSIRL